MQYRAEEAIAVVDAGLGEEVVALGQAGLHARQAYGAPLLCELVLRSQKVSCAT